MKVLAVLGAGLVLTGSSWCTFRGDGVSLRYPAGWHATARPLTSVADPAQIVAIASYPLPRGSAGGCSPREALDRVQPKGAFIFGWEYTATRSLRKRDFPRRPRHFRLTNYASYGCLGPSYLLRFRDAGRFFQIHVVLGRRASRATRATVIRVLDSFRAAPA